MAIYLLILGERKQPMLSVDDFDRVQTFFGRFPRLFLRSFRQYQMGDGITNIIDGYNLVWIRSEPHFARSWR